MSESTGVAIFMVAVICAVMVAIGYNTASVPKGYVVIPSNRYCEEIKNVKGH